MQKYTNKIELIKNGRGVWELDPFKGCADGIANNPNGCYGLCYAKSFAKFRGYDFGKTVYRYFKDDKHIKRIGKKIAQTSFIPNVQPPFIRLGVMCDPSYDWSHTLYIINEIRPYNPNIVIITKHWRELTQRQLKELNGLYVNTSICALDSDEQIKFRLMWYNILKDYCNSVLRVNTADFVDLRLRKRQQELLDNNNVLENILRIPVEHNLVKNNIVKIQKYQYLNGKVSASISNKSTYFGRCEDCPDQCGISFFSSKLV